MNPVVILSKFEALPSHLQIEVCDFIDFLIDKDKKSNIKIVPKFGSAKGMITLAPDFDAPLEDFKDYM